jgi:hypothetical protein
MEIVSWAHGSNSMYLWKSFFVPMEIIPWIYGIHQKAKVAKDMETATCIEVNISIDEWNFFVLSMQLKFPLGTWKCFHGRL